MSPSSSNVSFAARDYAAQKKIAGCYTLESLLFETPFAIVWSAQDDLLGRKVALYFLPDSIASDEKVLEELREKVRLNRQVLHPGIVRVYDLVEDVGCAAISMDLLDARPLAEVQAKKAGGVFSPTETKKWFGQLIRTGMEAHDAHLIHRDLSPDTVLVRADGEIAVVAFGISRTVLDALSRQQPNRLDPHLSYLSPQVLDGEAPAPTDDVYSFGALAFRLLTGHPPFYQNDVIAQIRKTVPPTLAARRQELKIAGESIPPAWEKAIAACLSKHTDTRPKSFKEVGQLMGVEAASLPPPPAAVSAPAQTSTAKPEAAVAATAAAVRTPVEAPSEKEPPAKSPLQAKSLREPAKPATESKKSSPPDKPPLKEKEKERPRDKAPAPVLGPPAPSPFSPFSQRSSSGDEYSPRKRGGGVGIAAGLGIFALVLIGLIYLASRQSVEPGTASTGPDLETTTPTGAPGGPAVPERSPVTLTTPKPPASPTPTPAVTAVSPTTAPTVSATPTPAVSPDGQIAPLTPVEDPASLSAEALGEAIARADTLFKQLTDQQTTLEETLKTTREAAATAEAQKLPVARKELETLEAAAKAEKAAEEKAAAEAEEARKAAENKLAALEAEKLKAAERQAAVEKQQNAVGEIEKEIEAAATRMKAAEADLAELKDSVTKARAERKRLTDARAELGTRGAKAEAERQQRLEAERQAAAQRTALQDAERAALEKEAAAAEQAATEAAALAEQARQALEKAARLRKASDDARQRLNSRTEGSPAPASSPVSAPSPGIEPTLPSSEKETSAEPAAAVTNSIGMKFAPVGDVLFSIWPTRLQDYTQFAQATGRSQGRWKDPGFEQGPDHPVVYVTWLDAIAFCQWLTEKEQASGDLPTNRTYRLPTDLEWSAAVGLPAETGQTPEERDMGISDVFPWGTAWPPPINSGNYTGEETGSDVAIKGFKDGFVYTSPVGRFGPSPTGLYDLGGNVWEWCMDWWNTKQTSKVLRGASWYNGALKLSLLSSCRVRATPDSATDNYGFRVVSSAIPKATALQ